MNKTEQNKTEQKNGREYKRTKTNRTELVLNLLNITIAIIMHNIVAY